MINEILEIHPIDRGEGPWMRTVIQATAEDISNIKRLYSDIDVEMDTEMPEDQRFTWWKALKKFGIIKTFQNEKERNDEK